MANIEKYTSGALAKTKKANEMIAAINKLLNMRFEVLDNPDALPEVEYADNNVVLRFPKGAGTQGFVDKTLTICENGSPVDYVFLVRE